MGDGREKEEGAKSVDEAGRGRSAEYKRRTMLKKGRKPLGEGVAGPVLPPAKRRPGADKNKGAVGSGRAGKNKAKTAKKK